MHAATCLACVLAINILQLVYGIQDVSGSSLAAASAADSSRGPRQLQASVTLYCNITGSCKPCKVQHLKTEACKQTGQAERLACTTDGQHPHQTVLHLHRQIDTAKQPLHVSRSCAQPSDAQAAAAATSGGAAAVVGSSTSSSEPPHPRQVYYTGSSSTGLGGLNVLYFELGMLVVLSGALPVVYIRKRRYVRL